MGRLLRNSMIVFVAIGCSSTSAADGAADKSAVQQVLNGFVDAWNRHDMKAFGGLFVEDATFVNVIGTLSQGRTAIQAAHATIHSSFYKDSQLKFETENFRLLTPDVAVAVVHAELTGDARTPGTTNHTRATFTLLKQSGQWKLAAVENCRIVPPSTTPPSKEK